MKAGWLSRVLRSSVVRTGFRLGDRDLGLNLERTRRLEAGQSLSQVTRHICQALGVQVNVFPMSDDPVPTIVITNEGKLAFQEYFVRRQCQPAVQGFEFVGANQTHPPTDLLDAINQSDLVIFCPSNPWVSIDPILAVPGIRQAIEDKTIIAVSPIIGGQTIKGPAAKMFGELGFEPSAAAVAEHYQNLLAGFVFDTIDIEISDSIQSFVNHKLNTNTIMKTQADRKRLADEIIRFGTYILSFNDE